MDVCAILFYELKIKEAIAMKGILFLSRLDH